MSVLSISVLPLFPFRTTASVSFEISVPTIGLAISSESLIPLYVYSCTTPTSHPSFAISSRRVYVCPAPPPPSHQSLCVRLIQLALTRHKPGQPFNPTMSESTTKPTGEALQRLLEHVRRMDKNFFAIHVADESSETYYNNISLTILNEGFSSATSQKSLHFVVDLNTYQPDNVKEYTIWVDDPKVDDFAANQAAVVSALESLIANKSWKTQKMVSKTA